MGQVARDSFATSSRGAGFTGDIGAPAPSGSDALSSGTWTVIGAGTDIAGMSDQFHFVAQPVTGDASLSCQIVSQTNTSGFAKAGIMFRNDVTAGSAFYACFVTPSNGIRIQARTTSGASVSTIATVSLVAAPIYVQVTRTSNTFTASYSSDGVTWTYILNSQYALTGSTLVMLVGLAVCSHTSASVSTVVASSFSPALNPTTTPIVGWGTSADNGQLWIQKTGSNTSSITGGKGVVTTSGQTDFQIGTKTAKDQEVRCRVSIGNSGDQIGIQARFSFTTTVTAYRFRINSGQASLDKKINGATTTLTTATATLTVGTSYWFLLRCTGTSIQARYWQDGTSEPTTWNVVATDSAITSGGFSVECNPTSGGTCSFDSFYAQDGFVTRTNATLIKDSATWAIAGGNSYWFDGSHAQSTIDDALATYVEMGANVVRVKNMANSQGPNHYEPTQNVFTESSLLSHDYALYKAGLLGLKIIAPFCDYFDVGSGWYGTFAAWNNVAASSFWTSALCISDYENYMSHILNHVNPYNGIAWKDDSTILCWESMNEPQPGSIGATVLAAWTQTMSAYTKSLDKNHLFMDGATGINASNLADANSDIYTNHYYPLNNAKLNTDITTMTGTNKAFCIGEYDWTGQHGGDSLSSWLAIVEASSVVNGDVFWDVSGHGPLSGWSPIGNYGMFYPGYTETAANVPIDVNAAITALRTHEYKVTTGSAAPTPITPAAPTLGIVFPTHDMLTGNLQWRGVMGAYSYSLESSTTSASTGFSVLQAGLTDFSPPFAVSGVFNTPTWYRIRAANINGTYGAYSSVFPFVFNRLQDPIGVSPILDTPQGVTAIQAGQAFYVPRPFGGVIIVPFTPSPNTNPWYPSLPTRLGREVAGAQAFRRDTLTFEPPMKGR